MGGHQVGHQILLLADAFGLLIKAPAEAVEVLDVRLAHLVQHVVDTMLGGNLELPADVVLHQLLQKGGVGVGVEVVVADARADKHLFDPRQFAQFAQNADILHVIHLQLRAGLGRQALAVLAQAVFQLLFAGGVAEVGGRAANVVDVSFKVRVVGHLLGLVDDRFLAAGDHLPSLVEGDGAEVAVAKAAAVLDDRELDLLDGVHSAQRLIGGVIGAGEGQVEYAVQLLPGEGGHRRILHQVAGVGLLLHDGLAVDRILPFGLDLVGLGVALLVLRDLVEGGAGHAVLGDLVLGAQVAGAADVADFMDVFACLELLGELGNHLFTHAVQQQVGLRVDEDGGAHRVVPVVVVGKAPQRGLQPADDDGGVRIQLPQLAGVDDGGAVRAAARLAAGGVGVVAALALGSGVVGDHRVNVAAGDQKGVFGRAKLHVVPVGDRLGDDADRKSQRLDDAGDDRRAKAGMVDIGVADDIDKIQLIPAARGGLSFGDGKKLRGHGCSFFDSMGLVAVVGLVYHKTGWSAKRFCVWKAGNKKPDTGNPVSGKKCLLKKELI